MKQCTIVALFTRAWIEIKICEPLFTLPVVALFTRAWIEIMNFVPPLERYLVALFTRAWIEISGSFAVGSFNTCRPFHEGVD